MQGNERKAVAELATHVCTWHTWKSQIEFGESDVCVWEFVLKVMRTYKRVQKQPCNIDTMKEMNKIKAYMQRQG